MSRTTSKVLLLTDSASAIDAVVQRNRAVGTAEGGLGRTSLRLRYVLKLKEFLIEPGDRVIASGLDGVYPKGALIGVVSSANPNAGGLFQEIEMQPSVDVYRLESVLVLIPELTRTGEAGAAGGAEGGERGVWRRGGRGGFGRSTGRFCGGHV